MSAAVDVAVCGFAPIDLEQLDRCAQLLTRRDRKYIVRADDLAPLLDAVPQGARALETPAGRWSRYESVYFDTPTFDSFRMAATKRRGRFKVRTRRYVDPGTSMIEIKTKDRRGRTVKHRCPLDERTDVVEAVHGFASGCERLQPLAMQLFPRLTTSYRRATLVFTQPATRVTIDADYAAVEVDGGTARLRDELVVETKTNGPPSDVDRLLWRAGYRPVRFSKYSTALAALHPELPHNRWNRVLVDHFGRPSLGSPRALSQ